MNPPHRFPVLLPLAALVFAAVHLAFGHFNDGVQSHNLLNRADLPAVSNWPGLVTRPRSVLAALVGAFVYGAVVAAFSFLVRYSFRSVAALQRDYRAAPEVG